MSSPMQLVAGGGVKFAGFIVWEQCVGIGCADQDTRYPSALLEEVGVHNPNQSPGCQVPPCTACLSNAQSLSFLENMTTFLWPEMF